MACGNWAEGRGYLIKGGSPFPAMVRYKETKSAVSIFTPENIASLLTKADKTLRPFLALGAFAGLRRAELQRLDWNEIDLDRGFITVDANSGKQVSRSPTRLQAHSPTLTRSGASRHGGAICEFQNEDAVGRIEP